MGQCINFVACNFSQTGFGVFISQGDTNGNGTGTPYPCHMTFRGCMFEDMVSAGIGIVTSNQGYAASAHPCLELTGCRGNFTGTFGTPDNGQPFIFGLHYAQIKVTDLILNSGYSYGAMIGMSGLGYTFAGSAPGPLVWELDNPSNYGTSRFIGTTANVSVGSFGDTMLCRLSPVAYSYTGGSGYQRVPFSTVVLDTWSWYSSANVAIQPTRQGQTIALHARVACTSVGTGAVALAIYKSGSLFKIIAAQVVSTAGSELVLSGDCEDTGSGAYYWAAIQAAQSLTLDTVNSDFYAELVGS
jgi:hypothetical protein